MTDILYEHPLNERIRTYLKLEQLFDQLSVCHPNNINSCQQVYFSALFTIIDTLERNDVRGDLIKDLEKLEQNLVMWSQSPDIDNDALSDNLKKVIQLISQLKVKVQTWWQLREDKFLNSVKQRFAIQGGSSLFDLPQLQFWLYQSDQIIAKNMSNWTNNLVQISQSLALVLKFIRQRSNFETITSDSGFFQDSGEGVKLLRIKMSAEAKCYPTVSGNHFRYSIRFMLPCQESGRRYANNATTFELARC